MIALAALSAASCMRIYPETELPDIEMGWPIECPDGAARVRMDVVSAAGATMTGEFDCKDGEGLVEDLARDYQTVTGIWLDSRGGVVGRSQPLTLDLRDGIGRRGSWDGFYGEDEGLVAYKLGFAGGESCATLGIEVVALVLDDDVGEFTSATGCPPTNDIVVYHVVPPGTYTTWLRGSSIDDPPEVLAASPKLTDRAVTGRGLITDLGTLVMSRCAPNCP